MRSVVDHLGKTYPSTEAMCLAHGVVRQTYDYRTARGWPLEEALKPTRALFHPLTGERTDALRLAREAGISHGGMLDRLHRGESGPALLRPATPRNAPRPSQRWRKDRGPKPWLDECRAILDRWARRYYGSKEAAE
jgi:hypothetical protein